MTDPADIVRAATIGRRAPIGRIRYAAERITAALDRDADPAVNLIAVRTILEGVADELESAPEFPLPIRADGSHHYVSTSCACVGQGLMADGRTGHEYCQAMTGYQGAKRGGLAKCCGAPCQCACHRGDHCSTCGVLVEPLGMVRHHRTVHATTEQLAEDGPAPECASEEGFCDGHGFHRRAPEPPSRTWTVTTTVAAPTPADAEHWAGTLRDLQLAEHGEHMDLQIEVAPVVAESPVYVEPLPRTYAWRCASGDHPGSRWGSGGFTSPDMARHDYAAHVHLHHAPPSTVGAAAGDEQQDVPLADWERELLASPAPRHCSTACEPGCGEICHEDHQPRGQRDHEPEDCPGFNRARHWLFGHWFPNRRGKPLPSMQETAQQAINDLAERGIRLVVPGYETPPGPTWPFGVQRGDWVTLFEELW